jgi:glycosyltransferase involved in cell wall biosynthesis
VLARWAITSRALRNSARPGVAARRVMRALHLGAAWSKVALWFDRRRAPLQIDDWSAPLVTAQAGSAQEMNALAGPPGAAGGTPAAEPGPSLDAISGNDDGPALRCLLATPRLDAGGVEEVIAFLARRLPSFGLQTSVLCATSDEVAASQPTGRIARMLQSSGVEVHEVGANQALDWIQRRRPDVISSHGAPAWVFDIAKRAGIPYVDNLHSMNGVIGRDWRWHSQAARSGRLAAVVAVSELLRRQQLAVNPDFPPDRIVTIPNGVDDERRMRGNRDAARNWLGLTDEYLFVSLARHCMQKNTYGLITAFGELARRRPEAHLVIAGRIDEPRYYRRVLRLRDSMPCRDRIHLRDHVAAPAQLLAAADGFVLDSFFEGWPLASMEALFAGVPVVITDVSGAREQIGDDSARGYVTANPLGDPVGVDWASAAAAQYHAHANHEEFAAAMGRLVSDRDDYLCNRKQLAAESALRFSSAKWVERHNAVLRAAANGAALPSIGASHGAAVG